jgi:signal transduction histidine kinase/PAS domain-containing protein
MKNQIALENIRNLEIAKKEWETTVDSLEQVVLLIDDNGVVIRGNRAVEYWDLGKVNKIQGLHYHDLFHPDCLDLNCYLRNSWDLARQKLQRHDSFLLEQEDQILGRCLMIQFRPIPFLSSTKAPKSAVFAVAVFEDITESTKAEAQVRLAAAELGAIFEALPEQFIRLDLSGRILAERMGSKDASFISVRESRGKKIQDIYPSPIGSKYNKAIIEVNRSRSLVMIEYTMDTDQGEQTIEARLLPLLDDQIIVINRNITEKIKLLSMAQTVDLMNNLGYIFSGIRHEIGNPINAIKMTISVLQKNLDKYPQEKIIEYTERVLTEINRVEYLLQNLKNFNMFEEVKPTAVPLAAFMEKFLALIRSDFEKKGVRIKSSFDPAIGSGYTDPRALHQVLLNIISNASDALEGAEDPRILIQLKEREGGRKLIIVEDNGRGMAPGQQKNIFQPFFTTKPNGTGLGLNIVQKILSRMGGSIEIDSEEGVGATVTISIPESKRERSPG